MTESKRRQSEIVGLIINLDGREWTVQPISEDEFIIKYPQKDKAQIVCLGDEPYCTGTYFKYNSSCPHIDACKYTQSQLKQLRDGIKMCDDL